MYQSFIPHNLTVNEKRQFQLVVIIAHTDSNASSVNILLKILFHNLEGHWAPMILSSHLTIM